MGKITYQQQKAKWRERRAIVRIMRDGGVSATAIAKQFKISRQRVYKICEGPL